MYSWVPCYVVGKILFCGIFILYKRAFKPLSFHNERIPSIKNSCEIGRLGQTTQRATNHIGGKHHSHSDSEPTRSLASFAQDYRKLAIDCLKVLRIEMQLETIFHMQVCQMWCYLSPDWRICYWLSPNLSEHLNRKWQIQNTWMTKMLKNQMTSSFLSLHRCLSIYLFSKDPAAQFLKKSFLFHPHKFHFRCSVSRVQLQPKIWPK